MDGGLGVSAKHLNHFNSIWNSEFQMRFQAFEELHQRSLIKSFIKASDVESFLKTISFKKAFI